jgi:hypothetical protein
VAAIFCKFVITKWRHHEEKSHRRGHRKYGPVTKPDFVAQEISECTFPAMPRGGPSDSTYYLSSTY